MIDHGNGRLPSLLRGGSTDLPALWSVFVYDPLAQGVWSGGRLRKLGVMDFAGALAERLSAGASALAIAQRIGKRQRFPSEMF